MVLIRIWLCSAFRVRQPNRPDSGIPASPAANRRILASFPLPASRAVPCRRPPAPGPSCDASCKKGPQHASQNPDPWTQPIEKEGLKRS